MGRYNDLNLTDCLFKTESSMQHNTRRPIVALTGWYSDAVELARLLVDTLDDDGALAANKLSDDVD